jgi:uncharacterized protein
MDQKLRFKQVDVKAAAREARQWHDALHHSHQAAALKADFPRLSQDTHAQQALASVEWQAHFCMRADVANQPQAWLHLQAQAQMPLTCQRCLDAVLTPLAVDRWFRFEKDEAAASAADEFSDEDVLSMAEELNLLHLVEDELLMAIPMIPMHDACPTSVVLVSQDAQFVDSPIPPVHPFSVLSGLSRHHDSPDGKD